MARRPRHNLTASELLVHDRLQSKVCRPRRPRPAPNRLVRKYKRLSDNDIKWIVMLRWNKLDPSFDDPIYFTSREISLKLHIAASTVGFVVSTFLYRGFGGYKRTYQRWRMLSPGLQERLISTQLLQEWAPLSLKQRCHALQLTGVSISYQSLSKFYREHGIKLRAADQCYKSGLASKYVQQRRDFALVLGRLVARGAPLIYVDESTFTSWMNKSKSWSQAH